MRKRWRALHSHSHGEANRPHGILVQCPSERRRQRKSKSACNLQISVPIGSFLVLSFLITLPSVWWTYFSIFVFTDGPHFLLSACTEFVNLIHLNEHTVETTTIRIWWSWYNYAHQLLPPFKQYSSDCLMSLRSKNDGLQDILLNNWLWAQNSLTLLTQNAKKNIFWNLTLRKF